MKSQIVVANLLLLLLVSGQAVWGENPLVFDLPKFYVPPALNGIRDAGEWDGALMLECSVSQIIRDGDEFGWRDAGAQYSEISANQLVQNEGEDGAIARTDADVSAHIWHGWDDEAFYFIAEVRDNVHDVDGGSDDDPMHWWTRDSVSLYVDLTNSRLNPGDNGGLYTSLNVINFAGTPQNSNSETITWERTIDGSRNATQDPTLIEGFEYAYRDAGSEFGGQADYVIEGKIPWETLMRFNLAEQPTVDTQFGFSWIMLDPDGNDGYGGQLQCWGWAENPADYSTLLFTADPIGSTIPNGLVVSSPNGGEIWGIGTTHKIWWVADPSITHVKIEYSLNNGTDWHEIVASTENDRVYEWQLPDVLSREALVRVSDAADGDPVDVSDGVFSIALQQPLAWNEGWRRNPANGHYYKFTDQLSWLSAEAQSVRWGGHLVTINDQEEEDWLERNFGHNYWIGMNDIQEEGNWVWASGEPVTYTRWYSGEPNNTENNEDAAIFEWDDQREEGWNDVPADGRIYGVVEVSTPDLHATVVTQTLPFGGGLAFTDSRITAVFGKPMDTGTLNPTNFRVSGSASGAVTGTVTYDAATMSATFIPDAAFQVGETVTVKLTGAIASADGWGLDSDQDGFPEGSPDDDYTRSFIVQEPLVMTAYPTGAAPTLDGEIAPGEYAGSVPVYLEFTNWEEIPGIVPNWIAVPDDAADLSYTTYALYTGTDLYVAVEVEDQAIRDDSDSPWYDDDVELYIDGDRVSNDIGVQPEYANAEGFQILMDIGGDVWSSGREFGTDWFAAAGTDGGKRVVEFRLPLSKIDTEDGIGTTDPGPGALLGFNITVGDDDDGGDGYNHPEDGYGAWSGMYEGWLFNRENDWGRLYLSPNPAPPLSVVSPNGSEKWPGSATRPVRWVADGGIANVRIEYSTDNGTSWNDVIASTPNTGTFAWEVPMQFTEEALVRISDAANAGTSDVSDRGFAIREPHVPYFETVWHERGAVFPDEPVDIFARVYPGDMDVALVQAKVYSDADALVATVTLNGTDEEYLYSGQWSGASELGYYRFDMLAEDTKGNQSLQNDRDGVVVAHDILRFPTSMLVSPEQLDEVRVPMLIDDDGSGYLANGFLSAEFDIDLWERGLIPVSRAVDFTGTGLDGGDVLRETYETEWWDDYENWRLYGSLASATPVDITPDPGPVQKVFAYVALSIDPQRNDHLGFNVSRFQFEERNEGVTNWCCGWLRLGRGDVDANRDINSFDASLVLMHAVHELYLDRGTDSRNDWFENENGFTFPEYTNYMADVSDAYGITALDASLIMQRTAGMITHFPAEEDYYRLWEPPAGWWDPPTPAPAKAAVAALPRLSRTVSLGATESGDDGLVSVPVEIDEMEGVLAGTFALRYDAALLEPAGVKPTELTEEYLFADHAADGVVRVGFAGVEWRDGSGALAEVLFRRLDADRVGELALSEVRLNEENVEVQVVPSPPQASRVPRQLALRPNFPNPFNPSTTILYDLPGQGEVRLSIYNLTGQRIRTLVDGRLMAGAHRVEWDGADDAGRMVASGVYLYRLETKAGTLVRKMLMVK